MLKKQVRKMLIEKGMNMKDFAVELGISPSYISYILNNKRKAIHYRNLIEEILKKYNKNQ